MTLRTPPLYLQSGSHTAENDRLGISGLVGTSGVSAGTTDLQVTQSATPAMTVSVNTGHAWVAGTTSTTQGTYHTYNDAAVTLTIATAPTSNTRIDLVCLTIRDSAYSGSNNDCILQVITGTAAASPSVPATPTSSIPLAQVLVGTNVTSIVNANITDVRVRSTMALPPSSSALSGYAPLSTPNAGLTTSTLAQAQMAQVLSVSTSSQTITLPTSGITAGYSTTLIAQAVSFTLTVPSSVTVYGTPSGTVTNASITIPANASFTLYNVSSSVWYYLAGGALPKASVSSTTGSPTTGTNGSQTYYKFTSSGSITLSTGGLADVLLVGGGGGGGAPNGNNAQGFVSGGGGAGGYLYQQSIYIPAGTWTVTIGAGGTGNSTSGGFSSPGGTTSFAGTQFTIAAFGGTPGFCGGVGGGGNNTTYAQSAGSGGGGGWGGAANNGNTALTNQGKNGGNGGLQNGTQGGGGGAGGAGSNPSGGAGVSNSITGTAVTYAAGGAGSGAAGGNATANSGNGGIGGTAYNGTPQTGGSGIFVVSFY